jgi:hypothetical protein
VRMRTIPYAAGTAVAAIGATLLLSGSASAAPAGDDRDPVPPGAGYTVCSFDGADGADVTAPRITTRDGALPGWRPARPATPREPEVRCADANGPAGTCAVLVPGRPAAPGGEFVPALPAEPGTGERADGPSHTTELTCEGAGVVQAVPRR